MNLKSKLPFFIQQAKKSEEKEPIWLEYLESDGNQYIDTGVIITSSNYRKEITLSNVSAGAGSLSPYAVMGSQTVAGGGARNPYLALNTQNKLAVGYATTAGGTSSYTFDNPTSATAFVLERQANTFTFTNGTTTYNTDYTGDKDVSGYTEWIFALNIDYSKYSASVKVYSYRLYIDDVLVRDLRPCLHPTTRRPAMYDMVEKKYYYNQGTGEFKYEETFIKLDYIESDGNQYIDTGYLADAKTTEFDFEFMQLNGTYSYAGLIGSRQVTPGITHTYNFFLVNNGVQVRYDWGWTTNQVQLALEPNQKHKLSVKLNSTASYCYVYMDDVEAKNAYVVNATRTTMPMFVGNFNNGGAPYLTYGGAPMRIYSLRVTDSKILMRDYMPVRMNDGQFGLYDFITGKFYRNAGTGAFKGYIGDMQLGEYLQSTHTQYIDTEYHANQDTKISMVFQEDNSVGSGFAFWGARSAISGFQDSCIFWGAASNYWRDQYDGQDFTSTLQKETNKHSLVKDKNVTYFDGNLFRTHNYTPFTGRYTVFLYAVHEAGAPMYHAQAKIYSYKCWDNGTPICDMIPAKLADGRIGMWDFVRGKLFENQGTGEFVFE